MGALICIFLILKTGPELLTTLDLGVRLTVVLALLSCCVAEGFLIGRAIARRRA